MKYQFINFQFVTRANIDKLSYWQYAQLINLAERTYNVKVSHPSEVLDKTLEGDCDFWQIVAVDRPDKVLYDCWVFDADKGVVFHTQTTEDVGVKMHLNWFHVADGDSLSDEEYSIMDRLAVAIQFAFNEAERPETPGKPISVLRTYRKVIKDANKKEE